MQGPGNTVGVVEYECTQIHLPEFGELGDSVQADLKRAYYLQLNPKQRMLEKEMSPLLADQNLKLPKKSKAAGTDLEGQG